MRLRALLGYLLIRLLFIGLFAALGYWAYIHVSRELATSQLQARTFSRLAKEMRYWVEEGPSQAIRFPPPGPYDLRLGYARLPQWLESLKERGYQIKAQARLSGRFLEAVDRGLFPIYREKTQAGLRILDQDGTPIWWAQYPQRVYASFQEIPPIVVRSLLFIENRELLDEKYPTRNPAVEWDRLAKAVLDMAGGVLKTSGRTPGGSTIATQLEKYRHSPEGRTHNPVEKLRQMASASFRAYLEGENTLEARRDLVVSYLNSIPLAAIQGYGEVNGLGDGLWAWCEADFKATNELLRQAESLLGGAGSKEAALAFRRVLSLLLAHRRPSYYLTVDQASLNNLVDSYLRLMVEAGVIPRELGRVAMELRPSWRQRVPSGEPVSFLQRKAANSVRMVLLNDLGMHSLYDLDRLDLKVMSTFQRPLQEQVSQILAQLADPSAAQAAGLRGPRLLGKGDPSRVFYSLTLYERTPKANLLRVQTDNFDGPFNINEGVKLDLGSTAKLRTLVHYLEVVAWLHERYSRMPGYKLLKELDEMSDPLSRWALEYLIGASNRGLDGMLEAALERTYSASPEETFFTGGGLHNFENFDPEDNHQVLSVREAFRRSVNLVFVRLMRDLVHYHVYRATGLTISKAGRLQDPQWKEYLARFADREGREYLSRFYRKYRGKSKEEALELLLHGVQASPRRLAAVFRFVRPEADRSAMAGFLRERLPHTQISDGAIQELYRTYDPKRYDLADKGFLTHVHPLELWLVAYLQQNPQASRAEVMTQATLARQEAYKWLLRPGRKKAQERRVAMMMEVEAFERIHSAWKRTGYPFESLVPSYATAIGSSADQPAALAELVGILLNEGVRLPTQRLEWLHFAEGTPYETFLVRGEGKPERVLPKEVARAALRALVDVVENGTARRLKGAFKRQDGSFLTTGGKTGTGDHRYELYGAGGKLLARKVMNRTATFVFFLGERYYGAVTAFVPGPEAANYDFTSGLAVQLLKALSPVLEPVVIGKPKEILNKDRLGREKLEQRHGDLIKEGETATEAWARAPKSARN